MERPRAELGLKGVGAGDLGAAGRGWFPVVPVEDLGYVLIELCKADWSPPPVVTRYRCDFMMGVPLTGRELSPWNSL